MSFTMGNEEQQQSLSLTRKIFNQLRDDILSGKYENHAELRENNIAKEYHVSRTPVREAIRQLELEGLVVLVPNKGAYVNAITKKDVADIYSIRSLLEGLAAEWAALYVTEDQVEVLEEIIYLTGFHLKKKHYEKVFELDGIFHEALYEAANSHILKQQLKTFHEYLKRVRKYSLTYEQRAIKSCDEHAAIVEAIKNKNPQQARELAERHISNTIENIHNMNIDDMMDEN